MPNLNIEQAEFDWIMQERKVVSVPGKPKKFESVAMVMKRIREKMEVGVK